MKKDILGSEISQFMEDNNYKIQYEADGYLNQDNFKDKILVLQENDENKSTGRLTIILFGQKQGYKLFKESYTIMPPEYTLDGYKLFDIEDVTIEKNKIAIDLSSIGPNGHIYFEFLFQNNNLELYGYNGYFMGAGSHTEYIYKAENKTNGTLEETVMNTMEDDMRSTTKSYTIKLKSPADFENFDHSKFLTEISQQTE
ncbi:hypothetical protein [Flavobacterium branchiicola]|uniref:Lipoprotein n=1 Tax=Flavobacterium branchiicola TaxID=1114875 RepID=A0ABV9PHZ3_9FLAO|nr:hypothetical protein [Flavobacterium branchiicola]MBS7256300.1 hypothetical protein [Flavobacterium branchiicola]